MVYIRTPMLHQEITEKIIGCAFRVHSELGSGFQELIYQRALALEMAALGLIFVREKEIPIYYQDTQVGTRRVDFFVENIIMLEIKALSVLEPVHLAQAKNYLEAYGMETGLLINFGAQRVEVKRLFGAVRQSEPGFSNHPANPKILANRDPDKCPPVPVQQSMR